MYYEIYADSLFLLQFFLNLYLLGIVNHMLYHAVSGKRIVLGAAVGAACAMVPFFLPIKLLYSIPFSLVLSFGCMSLLTFRTYKREQLFAILEKMLIVTLLLGGLMMFLLKLLPPSHITYFGIIGVLALGAICYVVVRRLTVRQEEEQHLCRVILQEGTRSLVVEALLDTGNSLVEPISGKPVAVLEEGIFQELFHEREPEGYRVIPYRSVGKANGILSGYLLKSMTIELQGVKKECKNVYVAISKEMLSEKSGCRMILNPKVLKE